MKNSFQLLLKKQSLSKLIAFVFLAIISFSSKAQNYCNPTWEYNADGNMITHVSFGNINQTSPFTSGVTPSYEDFTTLSTTVEKGQNYSISVKGPSSTFPSDVVVFIDFNQNGSFDDAGESFYIGRLPAANPANALTISADITIPMSALSGNTTMRILKNNNIAALSDPTALSSITSACGSYRSGQVEEYTLNIIDLNAVHSVVVSTPNNLPATISTSNGTLLLTASVFPIATASQDVIWTIENGNAISINQNGLVAALANGTATVRATSVEDYSKFDEMVVTVNFPIMSVTEVIISVLNNATPEITVLNGTMQLLASVNPSQVSQDVIWSISSGNQFLSINPTGVVTALGNGVAVVRATSVLDNTKYGELAVSALIDFTGLEESIADMVSISPNPTSGSIYISLGGKSITSNVTIKDMSGKQILMKEFTSSDFSIDLSDFSQGIYTLIIQNKGELISRKILKI